MAKDEGMHDVSGKRTINLLAYFLALAWVVMARFAWSFGELKTLTLFRLCAVPIGIVICAVVCNHLLDRIEFQRPPRGYEVNTDEKKKRI